MSAAHAALAQAMADLGLPGLSEYRFHATRRWRFDLAWPQLRVAVEIDGRGRHQTVVGVRLDHEKLNAALLDGWRVFRFPATDYKPSASRKQWPGGARDWAYEVASLLADAKESTW